MRAGTIVVLLAAILLFAAFGWQAFGWIALSVLVFVLLSVGTVAVALWYIKRRMRRKVAELAKAMEGELRRAGRTPWTSSRDAIDVEGRVQDDGPRRRRPRDGADDPDSLEPPR